MSDNISKQPRWAVSGGVLVLCNTLINAPGCGGCPDGEMEAADRQCVPASSTVTGSSMSGTDSMDTTASSGDTMDDSTGMSGSGGVKECGDGVVDEPEECDDGPNNDAEPWQLYKPMGSSCTVVCKATTWCGDGMRNGPEACDDGVNMDDAWQSAQPAEGACAPGCVAVGWCGDGKTNGPEGCDNGTNADNPWQMTQPMSGRCAPGCAAVGWCGDEAVNGPEACDDGNQVDTDGCRSDCTKCGDGVLQAGEQCDDGDADAGDGCTPACEHEYVMFATKGVHGADFGGADKADAICMAAASGKLAGTYRAWVSGGGGGAAPGDLPLKKALVRTDGLGIVADAGKLIDSNDPPMPMLEHPINLDEDGELVDGYAWTGTTAAGMPFKACSGWTSKEQIVALIGAVSATDVQWTDAVNVQPVEQLFCSAQNHLYCFRVLEP